MRAERSLRVAVAACVVATALMAAACSTHDSRATASEGSGGQEVDVDMAGFAFRPTTVAARADAALVVHVHNRDVQHHTFTAGDVDVEVAPGKDMTVSIPARPAGTDTYYLCRFHDADGMKGRISHLTSV